MFWLGMVILTVVFIIACIVEEKYKIKFPVVCLLVFGSALSGMFMIYEANNPSAMDVYRHNTSLKITYVDGEPIDTVVIFKNNKKK